MNACPRCRAFVDDLDRHEDFCSRVNAALPYERCGELPPPAIEGYVNETCHARKYHGGPHIFDTYPATTSFTRRVRLGRR